MKKSQFKLNLRQINHLLKRIPKNILNSSGELGNHLLIKYLFKELLLYFGVSFLFLFMIFFVNQILLIVQDLLSKSAPFKDVMKIMFYSLPAIIAQSAPFATLVGFLMCLGRMNSDNEILIFRASGFRFTAILVPVLILGMVISIFSFVVNDYFLPLGTIKYNKLFREIMQSNPTVELEPNSIKHLNNTSIVIGDVNNNDVSDVILFDSDDNGNERIIVAGKSVLVGAKEEGVVMQLSMEDAVVTSMDRNTKSDYDVISSKKILLNVFDSVFTGSSGQSPREMTSFDVKKQLEIMKKDESTDARRINIWNMEYYKKFAIPFGSIFFAFLAFSIAFLFGKHNGLTIGLFVGIVICVLYWAMQISGQLLVSRVNVNAFACIWTPNFLMGGMGLFFYLILRRK